MTICFMGKPTEHWLSIYQLMKYQGKEVKSLWDLTRWRAPESPNDCFRIGLELIEAEAAIYEKPFYNMMERFVLASASEPNQEQYGVSVQ